MTTRTPTPDTPELVVADRAAWRAWLAEHHEQHGVWLTLAKKGTTTPTSLTYDDALLEALCHGWIDGQHRGGSSTPTTFQRRFTPRRARSPWSSRNVQLVEQLTADGLMHPAGLAAVEAARTDGRWDAAYAGPATITVPDDLAQALAASPDATAQFAILTSQNRYAILYRLTSLRRADTRARRVAEYVAMLERGETLHPQSRTRQQPS